MVSFETNLCLLSMNQEICWGGCVTQASVAETVHVTERVAGNESDTGSLFISHQKKKNIENISCPT